eukprot:g9983.t1
MLQDGSSTRRCRSERTHASGGGSGSGRTARSRRLVIALAVAVMASTPSRVLADCGGGLAGILSDDGTTCCVEACGQCGGEGCGDVEGLLDTDCCVNDIGESGRTCGVDGTVAPCAIDPNFPLATPAPAAATSAPAAATTDPITATQAPVVAPTAAPVAAAQTTAPVAAAQTAAPVQAPIADPDDPAPGSISTCENGYPGFQTNEACCSEFCGQCGGDGCGALGSADCCHDNIIAGDRICEVNAFEAPCIIVDITPAPLAEGETLAPLPAPTPPPSPVPVTTAPVAAPVMEATQAPVMAAPSPTAAPVSREIDPPTPAPVAGGVGTNAPSANTPGTNAPGTNAPVTAAPVEPAATPAPTAKVCAEGLEGFRHGIVCCPLECGQCGGTGCESLPGGETACCSDVILIQGQMCNATAAIVAPCIIGTVDDVEGAADAEEASSACSVRISGSRGAGGGGVARRGGAALTVAGLAAAVAGLLR